MLTIRRLVVYAILCLPVAYATGITFLSRRVQNYKLIFYAFGAVIALFVLNWLFGLIFPFYKRIVQSLVAKFERVLRRIITVLLLIALIGVTPIFTLTAVGILPVVFLVVFVVLPIIVALSNMFRDELPAAFRLDIFGVLLMLIYISIFVVGLTRFGSTEKTCKGVSSNPYLTPIVTREDIAKAPNIENCFPYDIKSDPEADLLFFTLKERRSGFIKTLKQLEVPQDAICVTRLSSPRLEPSNMIPIASESTATYPQRITVNPKRKEIYVVVLDINGAHSVKVVSYDGEWRIKKSLELDYEPIRVYVDESRNELIVVGYEGCVGTYDIDTYAQRFLKDCKSMKTFIVLRDTLVHNPALKAYYASAIFRRFALLDDRTFKAVLASRVMTPTIGLDYHEKSNRVYTAATLTREIIVLNGYTLDILDKIWTGITVRELYIDRKRDLIVTAGYADGYLDFYDVNTHQRRARIFVGKLARGIHIEQQSGRVFVASSCGLFEVRTDALLLTDDLDNIY